MYITHGKLSADRFYILCWLLFSFCFLLKVVATGIDGDELQIRLPSDSEVLNLISESNNQYKVRLGTHYLRLFWLRSLTHSWLVYISSTYLALGITTTDISTYLACTVLHRSVMHVIVTSKMFFFTLSLYYVIIINTTFWYPIWCRKCHKDPRLGRAFGTKGNRTFEDSCWAQEWRLGT